MDTLERMLEHNDWATRKLLEQCRALPTQRLHQRYEVGLGSIYRSLVHVIGAMERWSDRIGGRPLRSSPEDREEPYAAQDLMTLLDQATTDLTAVAMEVRAAGRLDDVLELTFEGAGPVRMTCGTALVHVLTHGVHHRAQVLNMLRRAGFEVPDVDAVTWELERATSAA